MPNKKLIAIISAVMIVIIAFVISISIKHQKHVAKELIEVNRYEGFEKRIIQPGESLFQILLGYKIPNQKVIKLTNAMANHIDMSGFKAGHELYLKINTEIQMISEFYYIENEIVRHYLKLKIAEQIEDSEYEYELLKEPYERKNTFLTATVEAGGTFLIALQKAGINKSVRQKIANILESQADMGRVQPGDWIEVLVDDKIYKGKQLPYSEPIYVAFHGKYIKSFEAFWYDEGDKTSAFNGMYSSKGDALASNAVRYPLNRIRVTSPYGKRLHPISGKWKMHQGIDYAGSTGTPVYTVTSGTVISAGRNGGYGKEVKIKHPGGMITQYAHLHRIRVKRGQRVSRGRVIGTVGSTGYSTGPHLHFGVQKNGRWVNPRTSLRMVGAHKLTGSKLKQFKEQQNQIRLLVEETKNGSKPIEE